MAYIEIKTRKYIDTALAQQIIDKRTVIGVLTTGKISGPAKKLLDEANIAWAENIPERHFISAEGWEVI
ncbi:MAG: hypothetical protein R2911_45520 [Caldilineaceae bacterium]